MIVVVDYGVGNLGAISNMLRKIGAEVVVSSSYAQIAQATKLILPGVGAFDSGMSNLDKLGLLEVLRRKVIEEKTPILGICLGLQLFTKRSEEGQLAGLGWLNAETIKFTFKPEKVELKTPHMGWNDVKLQSPSFLFDGMAARPRFYFLHSYHLVCHEREDIVATTSYGYEFVCSVQKDNVFGVQFHPEKSHKFGLTLLTNFARF